MFNPFVLALMWQRLVCVSFVRLMHQQDVIMHHFWASRRAEDMGRIKGKKAEVQVCGCELDHHYGHRIHDVDVERI
ncbi:MAG: hypothetical protein OEY85_05235 [Rhodospirillales bacterium]|nr:hypothetical protein [Rhodospirillales bacterium]